MFSLRSVVVWVCWLWVALGGSAFAQTASGTWTSKAPGPAPFFQGGLASDGTYLYAFGGWDALQSISSFRYSPAANSWSNMDAGFGQQIADNRGAFANGTLWSLGGMDYPPLPGGGTALVDPIYVYDAGANVWVPQAAHMPSHGGIVGVLGNKVYVGTGENRNGAVASREFYEFDSTTGTVTQKASAPIELERAAGVGEPTSNRIYVFGGGNSDAGVVAHLYAYDPTQDAWSTKADLVIGGVPQKRYGPTLFAIAGKVYVAGGMIVGPPNVDSRSVFAYDPATDTWSPRSCMQGGHTFGAAVAIGGKGYVYGGDTVGTAPLEEFDPTADGGANFTCTSGTGGGSGGGAGGGTAGGSGGAGGGAAGGHAGGSGGSGGSAGGGTAGGAQAGGAGGSGGAAGAAGGGSAGSAGGGSGGGAAGGTGGGAMPPGGCGCTTGSADLIAALSLLSLRRRRNRAR